MIELWHEWNSVHSFRVRIVLAEKRRTWVDHTVELLAFDHLQPAYLRVNPDGVVPTLVHDGAPIHDSSVICEYLDEVFPDPPLKPRDPRARAAMRRWAKVHDEAAHPAVRDISFQLLYKPHLARMPREELVERLRHHPRPERRAKFLDAAGADIDWTVIAASIKACIVIARRIDGALGDQPWLAGERFSLGDVAMAPFAERLMNLGMEFLWNDFPRGRAWAERVLSRASVEASRPPARHRLPRPPGVQIEELRRLVRAQP